MSIKKALVLSRTPWWETPRIRHQLTRLLMDLGFQIDYVEILFKQSRSSGIDENGLQVRSIREPIHHQLKPFSILKRLNSTIVSNQIKRASQANYDLVLNFNYDHERSKVFPEVPLLTMINDDFIEMAKPWMKSAVKESVSRVAKESDSILSVSYSIHDQLKQFSSRAELFLPWSPREYSTPVKTVKRDVILYYGFISRVDLSLADALIRSGKKFRFVGPIERNGHALYEKYKGYDNVEFQDPMPLEKVRLDDVFCSIALYDVTDNSTNAITASNRMFQILSYGIPLIYPNMPNLIKAPQSVISKCNSATDLLKTIDQFSSTFYDQQRDIAEFLMEHTKGKRISQIQKILDRILN